MIVLPAGLIVLVGAPGSGKSAFVAALLRREAVAADAVIASDAIAEELGLDHASDTAGRIFAERDRRLLERLRAGKTAIAESTNVRPEARARLLTLARRAGSQTSALRLAPSLDTLRRQHAQREDQVDDFEDYHRLLVASGSVEALVAQGFDIVAEVPGADQGMSPDSAAGEFSFASD